MLVRFQVENLKVLIRTRSSKGDATGYLVPLPNELALDVQGLSAAESLDDFIRLTPPGLLRKGMQKTIELCGDHPRPFFFEAVLDRDYLRELLARVEKLPGRDREIVKPVARQEADVFHLMLVVRGRFHYGLTRETLLPLRVPGARITGNLFAEMLNDQDLRTVVGRVAELVLDRDPFDTGMSDRATAPAVDVAALEHLAWRRFLRLANSAFRRSHMGLAAVVAYVAIRRVEVANLVTLSEGLRKGMPAEAIRARMVTYRDGEVAHV
jgi:vacuolar-type H+-ATPase subunit C/Vma6